MNFRWILGLSMGLFSLFSPTSASAISLFFTPSPQTVLLENQASVDISITNLGNQKSPSLGAFDIDISFNSTILSFAQAQFGNQLDLGILGSLQDVINLSADSINISKLSFEDSSDLNATQPDNFKLATLTFNTLNIGKYLCKINYLYPK